MSWPTSLRTLGAIWILGLSAMSCHLENAGSLEPSIEVAAAFEALQVPPGYRYYLLNQENNPFGVAGLKSGYVLEDPDWRSVDPASPVFKKVVELVKGFPARGGSSEGYVILDPQKSPIGIWYSSLGAGVSVDPNTRRVMITTARPWLQQ